DGEGLGTLARRNLAAIKGTHWSRTGVRSSDGWMLSPISPSPNCKLAWQSVTWWSVRLPSSASFVISTSPLKKSLHAAEQDRPDVVAARKALLKMQMRLDTRRLAFIDETSVSTNMTRRYGRARGARLVCKVPHETTTYCPPTRDRGKDLLSVPSAMRRS